MKKTNQPSDLSKETTPRLSRRDLFKGIAGLSAASAFSGCASLARERSTSAEAVAMVQPADVIRRENARPGTRDWMLTNTRIDAATKYRCPWIEGYCSRTSLRAGEQVSFHVSTNPPSPF